LWFKGTAEVTLGNEVRSVHENESIYIPIGSIHEPANPGKIPLELVEVQVRQLSRRGRHRATSFAPALPVLATAAGVVTARDATQSRPGRSLACRSGRR
jgi:hypothetical protein